MKGNSLVVQGLGLHAFTGGGVASIPGRGTKRRLKVRGVAKKKRINERLEVLGPFTPTAHLQHQFLLRHPDPATTHPLLALSHMVGWSRPPKAPFSFWTVPTDGPVASTPWSRPWPPHAWQVPSRSEPARDHRGRISRLSAESLSRV